LKQGHAQIVEIRIERPPIAGAGGASRAHSLRNEAVVARAIAVKLRALKGRFIIDSTSPETLWDQGAGPGAGRLASEDAVWRFAVTPLAAGRGALQLSVSARTLGADGVLVETQLPDQAFEVKASANVGRIGRLVGQAALAVLAGMVLIKAAEMAFHFDPAFLLKQLFTRR
jgi:hypothetical protein